MMLLEKETQFLATYIPQGISRGICIIMLKQKFFSNHETITLIGSAHR